jgi:hypothetical protein
MHLRKISLTLLLVCIFAPSASEANGYKVTPLIIDKEVSARDIFSESITITNNNGHKIRVYPTVNVVSIDEGGDITSFTPPSMSDNTVTPSSWVQIKRGRTEIEPGDSVELPLQFKIHPEAEPGVYHLVIGFGTGKNRDVAQKKVQDGIAPSTIVTLKIDQDQTEFLKLGRFIVDRFVTSPENKAVQYTLTNPGEATVVPTGEVIFYDSRGAEVAAIPVNPDQESLTPGQETTYTIAAPIDGLLGRYKAFLSVDYGTEQIASVYDTTFFYAAPWRTLLVLFGSVLGFAVILTILLHRRFGRVDYEDGDGDHVPMFLRESVSEDKDHDINLKNQQ